MKEFKNLEDEHVENKFNEDLKEIKDKLKAEKLSDEFKEKLQAKLEEEYYKTPTKDKGKIIKFPVITRKLAGICACFVLLFSSYFAFADEIENAILNIFCNSDKIVENAIANGNYREIDMEYVENNGVSVKVDYVVVDDDNLYIAFNVLGEDEFDKIVINEIDIRSQENAILYTSTEKYRKASLICEEKSVTTSSSAIVYKLSDIANDMKNITQLKFEITDFILVRDKNTFYKFGKWNFEINI